MSIEDRAEEALVAVAESIGSTLGNIAATATKARKAITPKASTQRRVKGKARGTIRRASRKASAATRTGRKTSRKVRSVARKATKAGRGARR
jgi:hypothetical protein